MTSHKTMFVSPLPVLVRGRGTVQRGGRGVCAKLELPSERVNVVAKRAVRELKRRGGGKAGTVKLERRYGKPGRWVRGEIVKVEGEKGMKGKRGLLRDGLPLHELAVGTRLTGTVQNMMKHGVYVDVGAVTDGLVHVRDMSSGFVHEPRDLVRSGDEVDVWVKYVDPEKRVLGLSMVERKLGFGGRVEVGMVGKGERYRGVVERVTNYGVYVDIGAERLGFLHVTGLWGRRPRETLDEMRLGDGIWVEVVEVDGVRGFIRMMARGEGGKRLDEKMRLGEKADMGRVGEKETRGRGKWRQVEDDDDAEIEVEGDEVRAALGIGEWEEDEEEDYYYDDEDEEEEEEEEDVDAEFEAFFDEMDEEERGGFETEHGNVEASAFSKKDLSAIEDIEEIEHMFDGNTDFLDDYQVDHLTADVL